MNLGIKTNWGSIRLSGEGGLRGKGRALDDLLHKLGEVVGYGILKPFWSHRKGLQLFDQLSAKGFVRCKGLKNNIDDTAEEVDQQTIIFLGKRRRTTMDTRVACRRASSE